VTNLAMSTLIRNLTQIATPHGRTALRGRAMRELVLYENAVIVVRDGRFAFIGRESDLEPLNRDAPQVTERLAHHIESAHRRVLGLPRPPLPASTPSKETSR